MVKHCNHAWKKCLFVFCFIFSKYLKNGWNYFDKKIERNHVVLVYKKSLKQTPPGSLTSLWNSIIIWINKYYSSLNHSENYYLIKAKQKITAFSLFPIGSLAIFTSSSINMFITPKQTRIYQGQNSRLKNLENPSQKTETKEWAIVWV